MSKLALLTMLATAAWLCSPAHASPAPSLPLPPCVNGQGACPLTNPLVTATASGTLAAGGRVLISTEPANGVCGSMDGYSYIWTPSGCYAGVAKPVIVTCAYIDLKDMRFKEMACQQALYKKPAEAPVPLFTLLRPAGNTDYYLGSACGAEGDYQTFAWGGLYTIPEAIWPARGPKSLQCELSMGARRPDGLYGPTWAKVRVGIIYGENGIGRSGRSESAEFYVPIDGDLRGGVDVSVLTTHQLSGSGEQRSLKLNVIVENKGEVAADSVQVAFSIPDQLHLQSVSDSNCTIPPNFVGASLQCTFALPGKGDALGRNLRSIDIQGRILNAADMKTRLTFKATAANDADPANNEDSTNLVLGLRAATEDETLQLMEALAPYFDYKTPDKLLNTSCDRYMNDIYARLNGIREQHPEVFANLSFGRVTSGEYIVPLLRTTAGHVGVVVYPKGSDYHQSGVIIHGTPTWSPTDLDSRTRMGTQPVGDHRSLNFFREGTADHGLYYRTPLSKFSGHPKPEAPLGCGFEGVYAGNAGEFSRLVPPACTAQTNPEAQSCPFYPDAVVVQTESPVEVLITNPRGQRVETSGGQISKQELDGGIFSFPVPHDDGTFGWTIVLPKDRYDIKLTGTGSGGPYKLTMRKYDAAGKREDKVVQSVTAPGQVDSFVLEGAAVAVLPPSTTGGTASGGSDSTGGGGAMDYSLLTGLGLLLLMGLHRRWAASARTVRR